MTLYRRILVLIGILSLTAGFIIAAAFVWQFSERQRHVHADKQYDAFAVWSALIERDSRILGAQLRLFFQNQDNARSRGERPEGAGTKPEFLEIFRAVEDNLQVSENAVQSLGILQQELDEPTAAAALERLVAARRLLRSAVSGSVPLAKEDMSRIRDLVSAYALNAEQLYRIHRVAYENATQAMEAAMQRETLIIGIVTALGAILGIAMIASIMAQLRKAENALKAAKNDAEQASRTKSSFLANMSHELRTPLNAIIGFSEVIHKQALGPDAVAQYREYAGHISDSGEHLLHLVNEVLDLSKIECGEEELHEETVDVSAMVHSATLLVEKLTRKGNVRLVLEVPETLPMLHADARKLKQILLNILSNGVKFTEPGGSVTLKVWCRSGSGFVFQIADTGIGIALKDIPKVLMPFKQVDSARSRGQVGTGLGLPLAKEFVEMHGGSFDLQSDLGVGTVVTIRFPAERIAGEMPAAAAAEG